MTFFILSASEALMIVCASFRSTPAVADAAGAVTNCPRAAWTDCFTSAEVEVVAS